MLQQNADWHRGTPIIIGGGDGVCAAVGAGSVREGDTFNYLGSSSWVAMTSAKPILIHSFEHITGTYGSGNVFAEWNYAGSRQFLSVYQENNMQRSGKEAAENGISAYELMNREIEKSPVGANGLLYLPYILGERSPRWNTNARGAFVGLKMEHTRGDMLRATIEGILMNLCIILDVFRKDMDITELNVIGGLAKGDVVRRALADIYGVRAKRLNWLDEATSMGAAVCAGVGAGVLEDFGAIHRFIKVDDVLEPDMEHHKRYNELKQYFDECYTGLLKTYDNLAQWK